MAKEKAQPQPALQEDPVSQLGAIQSIIIGPAMAEFRQRLASLQQEVNEKHEEHQANIQGLKDQEISELTTSLDALTKRFEAFEGMVKNELDRLNNHKANWEEMGNMIIKLGESVKNSKT
ncbi:MAG: hypothetical protein AAF587_23400 [Bacteroidota bacterium]